MTTINIPVTAGIGADGLIYLGALYYNYGTLNLIQVYSNPPTHVKTLIRFDLSSIPSSAICTAATLKLTASQNNSAKIYNIHKITDANGDWIEGTKAGATAGIGEPCYQFKKYNSIAWAGSAGLGTAGIDFVDTVIATTTSITTANNIMEIPFNADGLTVLQSWFGSTTNNGLIFTTSTIGSYTNLLFHSGEATTESYRPILSITYEEALSGISKHFMYYQRLRSL